MIPPYYINNRIPASDETGIFLVSCLNFYLKYSHGSNFVAKFCRVRYFLYLRIVLH